MDIFFLKEPCVIRVWTLRVDIYRYRVMLYFVLHTYLSILTLHTPFLRNRGIPYAYHDTLHLQSPVRVPVYL